MRQDGRPFEKDERQRLITSIVTRRRVGTQNELLDALARAGCQVTQATISRDIRELGLDKTHDVLGRPRYVAPHAARTTDPRDALAGVLSQFGRRVVAAQSIVDTECFADLRRGGPDILDFSAEDDVLNAGFDFVVEFVAIVAEELDSVILVRVV